MTRTLQFYLRRLHGITGIFPAGYFLLIHLKQGESFSSRGIIFALLMLWLPLLFHSLYGMFITYEGTSNVCSYAYVRNYMYYFQRLTGLFIFIFLGIHIYLMKTGRIDFTFAFNFFLFCGVVISIFHFSNGFFGFLADMGIAVGERAQKAAVVLSFIAFIVFGIYGMERFYKFIP